MKCTLCHIIIIVCVWVLGGPEVYAQSEPGKNVASIRASGTVFNRVALEALTSELVQNPVFNPNSPEQQTIVVDPVSGGGMRAL